MPDTTISLAFIISMHPSKLVTNLENIGPKIHFSKLVTWVAYTFNHIGYVKKPFKPNNG